MELKEAEKLTRLLDAIRTIGAFMAEEGNLITTGSWEAKDGAILKTDWGYFTQGLDEIFQYAKGQLKPERREP